MYTYIYIYIIYIYTLYIYTLYIYIHYIYIHYIYIHYIYTLYIYIYILINVACFAKSSQNPFHANRNLIALNIFKHSRVNMENLMGS